MTQDAWAPYMHWAKTHERAAHDLTGSNLLACELADLPGARGALELSGPNDEGYAPLLEAIAGHYGTSADRVCTASGCSGANFLVIAALVRSGEEILVERPGYDPHVGAARLLGATVRRFDRTFDGGFALEPERVAHAVSDSTRLIVVTNPHNPSGVVAGREALEAVGRIAEDVGAKVLVDEVYLDTLVDRSVESACSLGPAFISTSSLTKAYGLSGLRGGWAVAEPGVVEAMRRVRDVVDAVGSFPSERLATLAFERLDSLLARARGILVPNMELLCAFVDASDKLEWVRPQGGAVGFPRIRGLDDCGAFVERLHSRHGVGVVPGAFFEAPAHFRVAVGGRREVLEQGLDAMGEGLDARI